MSGAADGTFAGVGGVPIYWRRVAPPEKAPRAVVLLSHGYAEHLGRYEGLFAHCAARGFAVASLDHRGHGRSGGLRGHCRDLAEMVADLRTLAQHAETWWPDVPRVLLGHSMGGLIGLLYLLAHPDTVRAGALTAPALRVPDVTPRWLQAFAQVLGRVAPTVAFRTKLRPEVLSRDPEVGRAYAGDPLVHRAATAGAFRAIRAGQRRVFENAQSLWVPLLMLQGDADQLVDPTAPTEIAARLTCPHELVMLPGYYHELLNEPPAERARVLGYLDGWFDRWI